MSGEDELERQAQAMAEKALAALPEAARAAKIAKVKEGILKRLREQAAAAAGGAQAPAAGVPAPPAGGGPGIGAGGVNGGMAPPAPPPPAPPVAAPAAPPPPPVPAPDGQPGPQLLKLEGIEACGDEAWFADSNLRQALHDSVVAAHAEQKILVGTPADEIRRICPGGGRILGAGGVLRLGGAHLGGYGEADISYAYRQLSRALHPDKNPDIPEAPNAFKRLSEAADELRQGLSEAREVLKALCSAMGGTATPDMLERPQEALFAEATRLLYAVIALSGEGEVPGTALARAVAAFTSSPAYYTCQAQVLLSEWYDQSRLLDIFAGMPLRTAYDCAPKRFRAQFLCALNRATMAEAKRQSDCVRGNWQAVMMQFPEMGLWRDLREKLRLRIWTPDDEDRKEKSSKWDDDEGPKVSTWAKTWRERLRAALPRGMDGAIPPTDPEVRQLSAALWRDVTEWVRGPGDAERHLQLFTAEPSGRAGLLRAAGGDAANQADEWAYVPAVDIFLVLCEGIFGITAEGMFAENRAGHERFTFEEVMADKHKERRGKEKKERDREKDKEKKDRDRKVKDRDGSEDDDRKGPRNDPDFDWESVWRSRVQANRRRPRGCPSARSLSREARRRRSSGSRERKRSRSRRRRRSPSSREPSKRRAGRSRSRRRRSDD